MKPTADDLMWLSAAYPGLIYEQSINLVHGQLRFAASYDKSIDRLLIEGSDLDGEIRTTLNLIIDTFDIIIKLDSQPSETSPWPKVIETGGRSESIARKLLIDLIDLHMFSDDGSCCLAISYRSADDLTLREFILELVVPFFYRLSYVERHGIARAGRELWGEYSHGRKGIEEFNDEMRSLGRQKPRGKDQCPCGSGFQFENCCESEFTAWKRRTCSKR